MACSAALRKQIANSVPQTTRKISDFTTAFFFCPHRPNPETLNFMVSTGQSIGLYEKYMRNIMNTIYIAKKWPVKALIAVTQVEFKTETDIINYGVP